MPAVDLRVGDYAVHDVHGIGVYKGLTTITVEGKPKDFMLMEYRGGDKLYIPADQADRLQKYIGNDDTPKVNKMGGAEWEKSEKEGFQLGEKAGAGSGLDLCGPASDDRLCVLGGYGLAGGV